MPMYFCCGHCLMSQTLHPGFSDLRGSPPALSSTLTLGFFLFLNALASSFLIHSHVTYSTPCHGRGHLDSHVTYRTPCHARGYLHSYLGQRRISLGMIGILTCFSTHTLNLLITKRFTLVGSI